jgi:hypothetical protein
MLPGHTCQGEPSGDHAVPTAATYRVVDWQVIMSINGFPGVTTHCGCIFTARYRALVSSFSRSFDHTQRRTTVGRTPLDEWSIRRRDLYLTSHNTHNRQTSMPPVWFEPTISAGERPKTYALDRAATGTGPYNCSGTQNTLILNTKVFRV